MQNLRWFCERFFSCRQVLDLREKNILGRDWSKSKNQVCTSTKLWPGHVSKTGDDDLTKKQLKNVCNKYTPWLFSFEATKDIKLNLVLKTGELLAALDKV